MIGLVGSTLLLLVQVGAVDSVEAVRFSGNRAFSGRRLLGVVSTRAGQPLDERRLDADVRTLELFYRDNGFRRAQVDRAVSRGKHGFAVTFGIVESTRTRVGSVAIAGNLAFDSERLIRLLPVSPGGYYTADMLGRSLQAISAKYLAFGYPFVEVDGEWRFTDEAADLAVDIGEGPRCHISELRVRGNHGVQTSTVLRAAEIRAGELFNQERLQEARRRLYATKLFQRVSFSVLRPDSTGDSVIVRFDVVEQAYRFFTFGGGVETPPWRLLFSAGWEHDNVLNQGQQLEVGAEYSPDFTGDFRLSIDGRYRVPYLILTRIDFQIHPFFYWERLDTTLSRDYGIETGLSRNLTRYFSLALFNRVRLVADTSQGITNSLTFSALYDSRDDFFDPAHGLYVRPAAEVAGGWLRGDNSFYRLTAEARWFQALGPGFVLAARMLVGRDFPYGTTEQIPYYEAFTLGGSNSLRGYSDRSLGPDSTADIRFGPLVMNNNIELRSPYAFGWVGLVGFFDGGQVVGSEAGFTVAAYEYSAGLGVRVRTPIGPVRFDWGKRLRNPVQGDRGRFYLGLLHVF